MTAFNNKYTRKGSSYHNVLHKKKVHGLQALINEMYSVFVELNKSMQVLLHLRNIKKMVKNYE
jgi:hypothetical protein